MDTYLIFHLRDATSLIFLSVEGIYYTCVVMLYSTVTKYIGCEANYFYSIDFKYISMLETFITVNNIYGKKIRLNKNKVIVNKCKDLIKDFNWRGKYTAVFMLVINR
jgi:hypothetical protein